MNDLQLKAQKLISDDPRTKEHEIEALEENGVITLRGNVPSDEVSLTAEALLEETLGIAPVINKLHIKVEDLDDALKDEVIQE